MRDNLTIARKRSAIRLNVLRLLHERKRMTALDIYSTIPTKGHASLMGFRSTYILPLRAEGLIKLAEGSTDQLTLTDEGDKELVSLLNKLILKPAIPTADTSFAQPRSDIKPPGALTLNTLEALRPASTDFLSTPSLLGGKSTPRVAPLAFPSRMRGS